MPRGRPDRQAGSIRLLGGLASAGRAGGDRVLPKFVDLWRYKFTVLRSGVIGTLSGLTLGLLVAFNIDVIVPAIEQALGVAFLPGSIYLISRMPSEPLAADIVPIVVIALVLAFVATLYPSWRASRVNPAEALRYE